MCDSLWVMRNDKRVSFIIPCFNEMRTIGSVVEISRIWSKYAQIIVINDGSTDETAKVLESFKDRITILENKKNFGKGYALALGLSRAKNEVVVFLDADICGLTMHALNQLINPVLTGEADMTLGIIRFYRLPKGRVYSGVTGFRAIKKSLLNAHISEMKKAGFGVEWLLNDILKKRRVVKVELPYVYALDKFLKAPQFSTTLSIFKQWQEIITQAIRLNSKNFKRWITINRIG